MGDINLKVIFSIYNRKAAEAAKITLKTPSKNYKKNN